MDALCKMQNSLLIIVDCKEVSFNKAQVTHTAQSLISQKAVMSFQFMNNIMAAWAPEIHD